MKSLGLLFILAILFLGSCTPRLAPGPTHLIYPETSPFDLELRSFSFQPNHIAVLQELQDQPLITLRLNNTARIKHNFTLIDNRKNILVKIDLMPKESTIITIKSPDPGNYVFYCSRFLHRFLGMEGAFMVD